MSAQGHTKLVDRRLAPRAAKQLLLGRPLNAEGALALHRRQIEPGEKQLAAWIEVWASGAYFSSNRPLTKCLSVCVTQCRTATGLLDERRSRICGSRDSFVAYRERPSTLSAGC